MSTSELLLWESTNNKLNRDMEAWREAYSCRAECEDWVKWKFCSHLQQARARMFRQRIGTQLESLLRINQTILR